MSDKKMTPDECKAIGGHCFRFHRGDSAGQHGSFTSTASSSDLTGVTETCAHCGTVRHTRMTIGRKVTITEPAASREENPDGGEPR